MHSRLLGACLAAAGAALTLLLLPTAARAAISVEGGAFVANGTASGGGAVSLGLFAIPATPLATEFTFAAGHGGAVGTLDLRAGTGTTIGAGIGIGNVGATATTNVMYDALLAQTVAPHVALEGRLYFGPQRPSSVFAGLRLSI